MNCPPTVRPSALLPGFERRRAGIEPANEEQAIEDVIAILTDVIERLKSESEDVENGDEIILDLEARISSCETRLVLLEITMPSPLMGF